MITMLNDDLLNSYPICIAPYHTIELWCVGVGGTGSYVAGQLANIARSLLDRGKKVSLHLCDPDCIEKKNTQRQNFSFTEVGFNKAKSMALRLAASGKCQTPIYAYDAPFDPNWIQWQHQHLIVLVGCVDRHEGRIAMSQALKQNEGYYHRTVSRIWHIDAGNHTESGQVLVGSSLSLDPDYYQLTDLGCLRLPAPIVQHQGLLELDEDEKSCEQMVLRQEQSITVNSMSAAIAATSVRLLLSGTLRYFATYFDLVSGQMNSRYIQQSRIIDLLNKSTDDPRLKSIVKDARLPS
jgi:hypothetical protein